MENEKIRKHSKTAQCATPFRR